MTPQPQAPTPDRERLRLMVVVAHTHDFTHCAGTCGIHSSLGDAVTVVTPDQRGPPSTTNASTMS